MSLNFDTLFGPYQDKSKFLITYDWIDIDSTTGYVSYDGFMSYVSTGISYHMGRSSERYNLWNYYNFTNYGTYTTLTKVIDSDFDTGTFGKVRTVRGTAYFKVPVGINVTAPVLISEAYVIVKVRKWNGVSETDLVSVQSVSISGSAGTDKWVKFVLSAEIPETTIDVGESIRVTVEVWVDQDNSGTATAVTLCSDPQGITAGDFTLTGDTRLVFAIPYKIEDIEG